MKLIAEYTDNNLEFITEDRNGKKTYCIEGVFMQSNKKNKNGRVYEKKVLEAAVDKYVTEQVKQGRAVGVMILL